VTTSIGMFQLPPCGFHAAQILLFVMVDGWNLLASSLLKSFRTSLRGINDARHGIRTAAPADEGTMIVAAPLLIAARC